MFSGCRLGKTGGKHAVKGSKAIENAHDASKADFTGKLRGEDVTLEGIKTKEIVYVKRGRTELESLR